VITGESRGRRRGADPEGTVGARDGEGEGSTSEAPKALSRNEDVEEVRNGRGCFPPQPTIGSKSAISLKRVPVDPKFHL